MTEADIIRYCHLLPPFARRFDVNLTDAGVGSANQQRVNRNRCATFDPAFGWHFVKTLTECDVRFPAGIEHVWLLRTYMYEKSRQFEPTLDKMVGMASDSALFQNAVQALLIHKDYTVERTAATLGLDPLVVEAYEQLFFNVRDRLADQEYMTHLIWPYGRYCESDPAYYNTLSPRQRLLQTSYEHGPEKALAAAGYNRSGMNMYTGPAALQETQRLAMHGANMCLWSVTSANTNAIPVRRIFNIVVAQAQSGAPQENTAEAREIQCLGTSMRTILVGLVGAGQEPDAQPTIDVQSTRVPEKA